MQILQQKLIFLKSKISFEKICNARNPDKKEKKKRGETCNGVKEMEMAINILKKVRSGAFSKITMKTKFPFQLTLLLFKIEEA